MTEKDPFMIDEEFIEAQKKVKEKAKGKTQGIICPRRHYKEKCKVCEKVQYLYKTGKKKDEDLAKQKTAKTNFFINAVFPNQKDKAVTIELGKRVGNAILDKINSGAWRDVLHPKAGVGRMMTISKTKEDGNFAYQASPELEKADWDVPQSVLDGLPDLDGIVDIIEKDYESIFNINSIKEGDTIAFRMLPPWDYKNGSKIFVQVAFRHWGVTKGQIAGEEPIDWTYNEPTKKEPEEADIPSIQQELPESRADDTGKPCFGRSDCYDPNDKECIACTLIKSCAKKVLEVK